MIPWRSSFRPRSRLFLDCGNRIHYIVLRILYVRHTAIRGGRDLSVEARAIDEEDIHRNFLGHRLAIEDLLRDPESECRHARRFRSGPGIVTGAAFDLLLPPDQLVLAVAKHDDGERPARGAEGFGGAVAVAALIDN